MWYGQASYLQSIIPERDHLLSFAEMKVEQIFLKTVRTIPISKPMVDAKGQMKPFPSERRNAIAFAESIITASGQTNFLARELSPKVELLHALLAPNGISVQGLTACVSKLQEYEALDEKDRSGGALVDFIFLQPLGVALWGAAQKFYETLEATIVVQTKVDTVLDKMKKLGARNSFTVSDQSVPLLDDSRETISDARENRLWVVLSRQQPTRAAQCRDGELLQRLQGTPQGGDDDNNHDGAPKGHRRDHQQRSVFH